MNWFKYIFYDDWYPVWADRCKWETYRGDKLIETKYCWYEIVYSPYRDKYKLKVGGYTPKEHNFYKRAVYELNKYINNNEVAIKSKILN